MCATKISPLLSRLSDILRIWYPKRVLTIGLISPTFVLYAADSKG